MGKTVKVPEILIGIFLLIISIICIYPFYYVIISSMSNGTAVEAGKVLLAPIGVNFSAYKEVFKDTHFWTSYGNTFFYTFVGTAYSMCISIPAAFALAQHSFKARKIINILVTFSMWFNPGFIPLYLNYASLGAENNRWMIIVSFGIQAFNIILLRNYFESVPKELIESAKIDGANYFKVLFSIFLPVSKPALATVTLYYAMSRWNSYFWASVLLSDIKKIPLQVYIKQKIIEQSLVMEYSAMIGSAEFTFTTLIYALVVCSIIPVMIIFPLITKYFEKGVMVGAVKG